MPCSTCHRPPVIPGPGDVKVGVLVTGEAGNIVPESARSHLEYAHVNVDMPNTTSMSATDNDSDMREG